MIFLKRPEIVKNILGESHFFKISKKFVIKDFKISTQDENELTIYILFHIRCLLKNKNKF